jgi:hypothetical protein
LCCVAWYKEEISKKYNTYRREEKCINISLERAEGKERERERERRAF